MSTISADGTTAAPVRESIGFGKLLGWSSSHASQAANFLILGYFSIYCTDTLGLNPAVVGVLLLASKILDAAAAILSGYLVDRSPETRFGKARPWDLAIIGIWVFTAAMFATPAGLGEVGKYIWVFATYMLVAAVFTPLFSANQPLYLARVFGNRDAYTRAASRSGVVIGVFAIITAIGFPIGVQQAGKDPGSWAVLVLTFTVPLLIIGLVRFFTIREKFQTEAATAPRVTFKDIRTVLARNPYLWAVAGIQLVVAVVGNFGIQTYYFRYIVGNVGLIGAMAALNILILPVMIFAPQLIRKFSVSTLIAVSSLVGAVGFVIYAFAGANIGLLIIAGLFANLGSTPIAFLLPILIVDNATYNEFRGNRRLESVGGGVTNFAQQVGAGVAAATAGIVLAAAGYNGTASVQSPSALAGIVALASWFPAGLSIVSAVIAFLYRRMERELPTITAQIDLRRAQAAASAATISAASTSSAQPNPAQAVEIVENDQDLRS